MVGGTGPGRRRCRAGGLRQFGGAGTQRDPAAGSGSSAAATQQSHATSSVSDRDAKHQDRHHPDHREGQAIYWFAIDTPTKSNCTGSCATYWPPVLGKVTAAPGSNLPHHFGTITRSGGQVQATYDGHPLYTYAADTAPGQVSGNGLNVSGGLWWAMTPSGSKAGAPSAGSSSSSSSGYGSGY